MTITEFVNKLRADVDGHLMIGIQKDQIIIYVEEESHIDVIKKKIEKAGLDHYEIEYQCIGKIPICSF